MRVLIAEDDDGCRTIFRRLLRPFSSRIAETDKLAESLELLEHNDFDVGILDLNLTDSIADHTIDYGIPRMKELKPDMPIVVVSGLTPIEEYRERSLARGAEAFVGKMALTKQKPFILAVYAAILAKPPKQTSDKFSDHIEMLKSFVTQQADMSNGVAI